MKYLIFLFFTCNIIFSQVNTDPKDLEVWGPEPKIVGPYELNGIPSDAIFLFDGTDFSKWKSVNNGQEILWSLNKDKSMTVKPGTGAIQTLEEHGSIQLHIEWKTPVLISGDGQYRGNSGIFFQRRYEVQVLDSYKNRTYSNGQAGAIYIEHIPLVNASLPPGKWQKYDIIFNAPKYDEKGFKIKNGSFTVFHNGVLIQNGVSILRPTVELDESIPNSLYLQDHGDLVSFRNIWMRKL